MIINIIELEKMFELALANIKMMNGTEIKINADFYWSISDEDIYDMRKSEPDFTIGILSDDWSELSKLLTSELEYIPHDLKRISNILRAISQYSE